MDLFTHGSSKAYRAAHHLLCPLLQSRCLPGCVSKAVSCSFNSHRHDGPFATISGFRLGRTPEVPVEWDEINAAWGQAVLLLYTMAQVWLFRLGLYRVGMHGWMDGPVPHVVMLISSSSSSSSLHFQLRPACGLHEYTSQAALEHAQPQLRTIAHLSI